MDETASTVPAMAAFFAATLGWMMLVGVFTGALIFAIDPEIDLAHLEKGLTPLVLGLTATLQATGMGMIAVLLSRTFGPARLFPVTRSGWFVAAALAGTTIGLLPALLASYLAQVMPPSGLNAVASAMEDEATLGRVVLAFGICAAAPIGEELAFRGYVWGQLERWMPQPVVWVLTSVLFSAYHLDPVQAPALIPTALFLGWIRWASGSVGPAIVAHASNNVIATAALLHLITLPSPSIAAATAGTMATVSTCAIAWWLLKRS